MKDAEKVEIQDPTSTGLKLNIKKRLPGWKTGNSIPSEELIMTNDPSPENSILIYRSIAADRGD